MTRLLLLPVLFMSFSASATVFTFDGTILVAGTECVGLAGSGEDGTAHPFSLTMDLDPSVPNIGDSSVEWYTPIVGEMTVAGETVACSTGPLHAGIFIEVGSTMHLHCVSPTFDLILDLPTFGAPPGLPQTLQPSWVGSPGSFGPHEDQCFNATVNVASVVEGAGLSPLEQRVASMATQVNDAFVAEFGGLPPISDTASLSRRPAFIADRLQDALDALESGGCLTEPTADGHVSGTYGYVAATGADQNGQLTGLTLDRTTRTFGFTDFSGADIGSAAGEASFFNKHRQMVASRDDDGFVVGHWIRIKGARGVFAAVTGTCDTPIDPVAVLGADWVRGGLPD